MKYHFCTYFDRNYLPRGLALYSSLKKHCASFELSVLTFDEQCSRILSDLQLPEVRVTDIRELESADPALREVRASRSLIEYYFTCTPSWLLYEFKKKADAATITYLDADLFFFADPAPIYEEVGDRSIGIIAHRFPPELKHLEKYGIYNVGWLSFRPDGKSFECLETWRKQCLDWCYDRVEENRFADQKYLDHWPRDFGAHVIQLKGAGVAPWNIESDQLNFQSNDKVFLGNSPLIFYHFHGLRVLRSYLYDLNLSSYNRELNRKTKKLYAYYLKTLSQFSSRFEFDQNGIRFTAPQRLFPHLLDRQVLLLAGPIAVTCGFNKIFGFVKRFLRAIGIRRETSKTGVGV